MTCRLALSTLSSAPTTIHALDPACGAGHMLEALARVCDGGQAVALHGVDVQAGMLSAARHRLVGTGAALQNGDALLSGLTGGASFWRAELYDCVVGNPPYVRHEVVRDPLGMLPARAYKAAIARSVAARLPGVTIDGRADLAVLFALLGLSLLRPSGALGLIMPVAAIEALYARSLEATLRATGRSAIFLESDSRRSFPTVAVNTGILVAGPAGAATSEGGMRRVRVGVLDEIDAASLWGRTSRRHPARHTSGAVARVPLRAYGAVRYPVKTGLNGFFYPTSDIVTRFGIEERFLVPVVKSPRDLSGIVCGARDARARLFACHQRLEELDAQGEGGAAAYIRWGARQRSPRGVPWPEVPSLRGRRHWYAVPLPRPAHILCPRFFHRRYLFPVPDEVVVEDQTLYGLVLDDPSVRDLLAAVLNSTLVHLVVERGGRTGLGDGVLQYALCDMAALQVPDLHAMMPAHRRSIEAAYAAVARRPLLPAEREYQQADRRQLDAAVGEAYGIGAATMQRVREDVLARLERRQSRARSVR